jgi:hypothetical protein
MFKYQVLTVSLFLLFCLSVIFSVFKQTVEIPERLSLHRPRQSSNMEEPQKIKVEYEIEYGSFYTGNQTSIFCRGMILMSIKKDFGAGVNGMPISGIFPVHSDLFFEIFGQKAILRVPCSLAGNTVGLLEVDGSNKIPMTIAVAQKSDGYFLVKAFPLNNRAI